MNEHIEGPGTALPWEAASDGCLRRQGEAFGFLPIASPWVESAFVCDETAIANAAYIVRACNSFPALVKALEALNRAADDSFVDGITPCSDALIAAFQMADAALSLAKGERTNPPISKGNQDG